MLIIDKYITQSMLASASGLLATLCPPVVQAAEKPRGLSAAGLSGDVMGSGFLAQSATGLLVVLVSVVVVTWMIKRFGRLQSSAKGTLRMIDGMALSTREQTARALSFVVRSIAQALPVDSARSWFSLQE